MVASFLFTIRLPSEAIPPTRELPIDPVLSEYAPSSPSVVGLRGFLCEHRLSPKLASRKNERSLFMATMPCFCGPNVRIPEQNCPTRQFRTAVSPHTQPGAPLAPAIRSKNKTRIVLNAISNLNVGGDARYSAHCFRRGAATAPLNSGATLSQIMKTGRRSPDSFRAYLARRRSDVVATRSVPRRESPDSSPRASSDIPSASIDTPRRKSAKTDLNLLLPHIGFIRLCFPNSPKKFKPSTSGALPVPNLMFFENVKFTSIHRDRGNIAREKLHVG